MDNGTINRIRQLNRWIWNNDFDVAFARAFGLTDEESPDWAVTRRRQWEEERDALVAKACSQD